MKNLLDGEIFSGGAENRRANFRPPDPSKLGVIRHNDGRYGCACHASRRDRSASHTTGHHVDHHIGWIGRGANRDHDALLTSARYDATRHSGARLTRAACCSAVELQHSQREVCMLKWIGRNSTRSWTNGSSSSTSSFPPASKSAKELGAANKVARALVLNRPLRHP